ncbi:hypothetical protein LDO26_17280 [Luteimonas sp. BDR2-5]|uniref:hypothetical protein n=1 Tax=Proluteimonas luteida TaxID=2878685 RepID=UPI001E40594D|nr:hypothetical protein [Luteimonas sp. BDR2-5]MCD9029946.1 hypothetical protein [Luteimonas sp. BDR2-5]
MRGTGTRGALLAAGAALLVALAGCGRKSEAEQLAALRDSFTYKRYQQVSGPGLPAAVDAYRKASELAGEPVAPFTASELCTARVLLAYAALSVDKQTLTIAESDLIDRHDCDTLSRFAAQSLRTVTFQRRGWHALAHEHSQHDPATLDAARQDAMAQLATLHLVLIYAGVMDKRWDGVVLQVEGLAALIGTPWLGDIGRAALDIHEGRTRDGLRRIKRLSENEYVPTEVRTELAAFIAAIEAETGNLDDSATKLLLRMTWLAMRQYGPDSLRKLTGFVEDNAWRRLASAPANARERLAEHWRRWRGGDDADAEATSGADAWTQPAAP